MGDSEYRNPTNLLGHSFKMAKLELKRRENVYFLPGEKFTVGEAVVKNDMHTCDARKFLFSVRKMFDFLKCSWEVVRVVRGC